MQEHLDKTRSETVAIRTQVDKARRVLEGLGSLDIVEKGATGRSKNGDDDGGATQVGERVKADEVERLRREMELWQAVDEEFS